MFTTLAKTAGGLGSVRYDQSKAWQEGETPMGVQDWLPAFSNVEALGDGQTLNNIERMGDGTFRAWRNLAGGADDMVQSRTFTVNPDGTVAWKGSWNTKQQESTMDQFKNAAMLAAAGVGGLGAMGFGPAAGLFGTGGQALSGMDLAADAALGSGNNILTAGGALGSGGTIAGTTIPQFSQLPGYGNNLATLADASGASPFTAGASGADPLAGYLTTGASEGSTIGNALTGAGGAAGAVGAGTAAGNIGTAMSFLPSLSGSNWLNLGGNLLNSYLGNRATNRAVDAQVNAGREANALNERMFNQIRTDNLPALEARNAGLSGYRNLLQNPGQIVNDPGYKFGFDQGVAGYDNSGAARGMRLSGGQAKALTRFGQDYGQTKFNESLNRYGNLAGLGGAGSQTIAGAGQNYANTAGQNITGIGNAQASGYIGGANAITGGISNFLRNYQESNLLRQLGIGG